MKSSRAMLLAAILFSAPVSVVLAENTDNAPKVSTTNDVITTATKIETEKVIVDPKNHAETHISTTTEEVKTEKKGAVQVEQPSWAAAKLAMVTGAIGSATNFVSKPAAWGLNQFTRISYLKDGRFQASIPTMAKVITAAAIVGLIVKLHELANADDVDANDDEIFGDDNN
jgi:hypothetical protein